MCLSVSQQKPEALQNYFKQGAEKEDNSFHPETVRNCIILRDHGHPCAVEISENLLGSSQWETAAPAAHRSSGWPCIPAAPNGFKAEKQGSWVVLRSTGRGHG